MLPFPATVKDVSTLSYINCNKEFIFSDSLRQHYGKMSTKESATCYKPNDFTYACKEEILMYTYNPAVDCKATLLYASTTRIPDILRRIFIHVSKSSDPECLNNIYVANFIDEATCFKTWKYS
jgi:hypothetical protein